MLTLLVFASCQSVKPYQRAYLNDREMQFGSMTVEAWNKKRMLIAKVRQEPEKERQAEVVVAGKLL